uniref:Cationic amino acid transporter C-terminal domain-containing protein n=1 Tax=Timema monikensis TaxID=170555 RepID=A0A7R9E2S5_9NEOP|nr:unnamed protein product [Timema monikensis]
MSCGRFLSKLNRKKFIGVGLGESRLARVLTTLDLTGLGIGSTLGVGVYVLAGSVSKTTSGPAVVLSFMIAAIASVFAGLCYAEFGARVPKAGSAYIYSYVCVGEFVGFTIGWNLVLEYVIGAASVGRGLSTYIDALFDNAMRNKFREIAPIDIDFLSEYPDFFAFGLVILFASALAFGVHESSNINNIFTVVNVAVVLYVIITADIYNWQIPQEDIPANVTDAGVGGFFPFGFEGVVKGAATCFYGFVGFDCIATTGEEAMNPQKSIPLAIVISLSIIFLAYFGVSSVLTLMWPYYLQASIHHHHHHHHSVYSPCQFLQFYLSLHHYSSFICFQFFPLTHTLADPDAPIPHVFREVGWPVAQWIVSIGAIFGLFASLFGALFPLPRVIYAMSNDGLVFRFLGKVNSRTKTPVVGTILAGVLTAIMASIFNLQHLVDMMSIGTLMAYSIVAACVMLLRYQLDEDSEPMIEEKRSSSISTNLSTKIKNGLMTFCNLHRHRQPTESSASLVPLVPFIPGLSILVNIYLMMVLDGPTWIRFLVWMVIGYVVYFGYGIWNSTGAVKPRSKTRSNEDLGIDNPMMDISKM